MLLIYVLKVNTTICLHKNYIKSLKLLISVKQLHNFTSDKLKNKSKFKFLFLFYFLNRFLQSLGRHNYVTPTSYLELIAAFQRLLTEKRDSVMKAKKKYVNGLDKLAFAESQVSYNKYGTEIRKCLSAAGLFLEMSLKSATTDFV